MTKFPTPTIAQVVVFSLLALSLYLQSSSIAYAAVLALGIKAAKEFLDTKQRNADVVEMEKKLEGVDQKIRALQNDVNRAVVKQAQYFGE